MVCNEIEGMGEGVMLHREPAVSSHIPFIFLTLSSLPFMFAHSGKRSTSISLFFK